MKNNKQPFEKFPALTATISTIAAHGTNVISWSEHLGEINKVITDLESLHNQKLLEVLRGMERKQMERIEFLGKGNPCQQLDDITQEAEFHLACLRQTIATLPDTKAVDPVEFAKWVDRNAKRYDEDWLLIKYPSRILTDEELLSAYEKRNT